MTVPKAVDVKPCPGCQRPIPRTWSVPFAARLPVGRKIKCNQCLDLCVGPNGEPTSPPERHCDGEGCDGVLDGAPRCSGGSALGTRVHVHCPKCGRVHY